MTPLIIGDGLPAVLIERGWKARGAGYGLRRAAAATVGPVTVEGLAVARPSTVLELGSAPKLDVPGIWQNLDYDAYEKVAKRSVARFVVRQAATTGAADGLRREWPQPASGVDKHRGYAFQWYALAGAHWCACRLLRLEDMARAMKRWRRYLPLYVLMAITIVPIAAAYISYYFAPPAGRTNYGTLLQPQRPVPALSLTNLDGTRFDLRQLAGNWVFVMVRRRPMRQAVRE